MGSAGNHHESLAWFRILNTALLKRTQCWICALDVVLLEFRYSFVMWSKVWQKNPNSFKMFIESVGKASSGHPNIKIQYLQNLTHNGKWPLSTIGHNNWFISIWIYCQRHAVMVKTLNSVILMSNKKKSRPDGELQ